MIHNTNYMDIEHGDEESQPESWYTKTKPDDTQGLIIDENTGANIAVSYDPQHAALIAAAPELLAALNRLTIACGEADALQHAGLVVPAKVWSEIYNANMEARSAIAKAKGQ